MNLIEPPPHADPEKKKVLAVYTAFGLSLLMGFVPMIEAAGLCLVLMIVVLVWAYIVRGNAEDHGLADNHMTFIIRTIWIGSSLSIVTAFIGGVYMFGMINNEPLMPCVENLYNVMMDMSNFLDTSNVEQKIKASLQGCMDEYLRVNLMTLIVSGVIIIGPVVVYFAVRFVRGFSRAVKGYRVANEKSWF